MWPTLLIASTSLEINDNIGATEDRREELIRARNGRRKIAGRMVAHRDAGARPGSLKPT